MGDAEQDRLNSLPADPDAECKFHATERTNGEVTIFCLTHEVHALGTFGSIRDAYQDFRCDRGKELRFYLIDPSPIESDRIAPQFADLTDLVRMLRHAQEDAFYGWGYDPSWSIYQIRVNALNIPEFHVCSLRCTDFGSWDDNDYKRAYWEVRDIDGEILTDFSVQLDGRA